MKKFLRILLVCFFIFNASILYPKVQTQEKNKSKGKVTTDKLLNIKNKELEDFTRNLKKHKVIEAKFIQETYRKLRKKTKKTTGNAIFVDGSKFRWVVDGSSPVEWIFDGSSLVSFHPKEKYATRYPSKGSQGKEFRQVVEMITDMKKLREKYELVYSYKKGNKGTLKLVPFSGKVLSDIEKIEIQLNFSKYYINGLKIFFKHGNYSRFTFLKPRFSTSKKGAFDLPKGVEIVDAL